MNKLKLLLLSMLIAMPSLAFAHGPSRQKIVETIEVSAPPAEVWAYIGSFQDMSWHPAVFSTEGEGENNIDATRTLHLKDADGNDSGATISELLYKYSDEKMSYSYRIEAVEVTVLPVTNYSSHLTVTVGENGGSIVEWKGAFYRGYPNNEPPEALNDAAAIAAVTAIYKSGLSAIAEHFSQ